jgi:hypothetical protein
MSYMLVECLGRDRLVWWELREGRMWNGRWTDDLELDMWNSFEFPARQGPVLARTSLTGTAAEALWSVTLRARAAQKG